MLVTGLSAQETQVTGGGKVQSIVEQLCKFVA